MRSRWPVAVGVVLMGVGAARAQPPLPPPGGDQLPPLLPVPPSAPLPEVPRPGTAPAVDYDPGYLYLPEREPVRAGRSDECGPDGRWWVTTAVGLAWVPEAPLPTPVRLRIPNGTGGSIPGPILPVRGLSSGQFDAALGLVLGRWFGEGHANGVESSFFVRSSNETFAGFAPGSLVLFARGSGGGAAQVVPFPEPFASQFVSTFPATLSSSFTTVDVNYRRKLYCDDNARLDFLVGYRFAYLQDELYLGEFEDGNNDYKRNRASVSNPFHGGQIGLAGEYRRDVWSVSGSAKVAFGVVTPEVNATGLFVGAEGRTATGARRLAVLNGIEESTFAVLPTVNVQVARQVGKHGRLFTGYSFQYLSRAGRLSDALCPNADALALTDFWVQSITFGAEFRY